MLFIFFTGKNKNFRITSSYHSSDFQIQTHDKTILKMHLFNFLFDFFRGFVFGSDKDQGENRT